MSMRILTVWHGAVNNWYRDKIRVLANQTGVEMALLIPNTWTEGGYLNHFRGSDPDDIFPVFAEPVKNRDLVHRFFFWRGPGAILRRFKPDIIDLVEEPFSYVAFQILLAKKLFSPKSKIVFNTGHTSTQSLGRSFDYIQKKLFKNAPAALTRSDTTENWLRESGYEGRIFMVGNGVNLKRYRPSPEHEFLPGGKLRLLYIGRVVRPKGLQYLIEALSILQDRHWELSIIGDGPYTQELKQQIQNAGLSDRIHFRGSVLMEEVPSVLHQADLLVLPSFSEGKWSEIFGRVIIEAQACGIPVIASRNGGIPRVLNNEACLFPEKDSKAIADVLAKIGWDKHKLAEHAARGLENVRRFSWEAMAEEQMRAYHWILGQNY